MGSLGQYPDRVDYVENVYVHNVDMYNSSEGARIKVWPNQFSEKSDNLVGGGGRGLVRNITYEKMWLDNVDYGLTITQCYGQDDEEECFKHPVRSHFDRMCNFTLIDSTSPSSTLPILPSVTFVVAPTGSSPLLSPIWSAPAPTPVLILWPKTLTSAPSMAPTSSLAETWTTTSWMSTVWTGARDTTLLRDKKWHRLMINHNSNFKSNYIEPLLSPC